MLKSNFCKKNLKNSKNFEMSKELNKMFKSNNEGSFKQNNFNFAKKDSLDKAIIKEMQTTGKMINVEDIERKINDKKISYEQTVLNEKTYNAIQKGDILNPYDELKKNKKNWTVGPDGSNLFASIKIEQFDKNEDKIKQANEIIRNNKDIQDNIHKNFVKDGNILFADKNGLLYYDKNFSKQKIDSIRGKKHFIFPVDNEKKSRNPYVLNADGTKVNLTWNQHPENNENMDLIPETTKKMLDLENQTNETIQDKNNEQYKTIGSDLGKISSFISKMDSLETMQKGLKQGESLKNKINKELDKIGHSLVVTKNYWYVRRDTAKDIRGNNKVRLTIGKKPDGQHYFKIGGNLKYEIKDGNYIIKKAYNRISTPGKLNQNLEKESARLRPDEHEAHHLIPDSIAQKEPLTKMAIKNGYNIDNASNGIWLPNNEQAKNNYNVSKAKDLPIHAGNHPAWNKEAKRIIRQKQIELMESHKGKKLSQIDGKQIVQAVEEVEKILRKKIETKKWKDCWV